MSNIMKIKGSKAYYVSFIILECALWGIGNAFTKIGLETVSPFYCLAFRFTISFLVFMVFFRKKALAQINRSNIAGCLLISTLTAFFFIFGTLSLFLTTATTAGFFMSIAVLFTPFLSYFMLKKKINKKIYPIIAIVIAGAFFLCGNSGAFVFGIGEGLALLTSLTLALTLILTSKYVGDLGPVTLSTMQSGVAAAICFILAFFFEPPLELAAIGTTGWSAILFLAIGCTVIAYLLQNAALEHVSAVFASLAFCSEPIFTAIAAFFMLGEKLTLSGFVGCALIMAGILIASLMSEQEVDGSAVDVIAADE